MSNIPNGRETRDRIPRSCLFVILLHVLQYVYLQYSSTSLREVPSSGRCAVSGDETRSGVTREIAHFRPGVPGGHTSLGSSL